MRLCREIDDDALADAEKHLVMEEFLLPVLSRGGAAAS